MENKAATVHGAEWDNWRDHGTPAMAMLAVSHKRGLELAGRHGT